MYGASEQTRSREIERKRKNERVRRRTSKEYDDVWSNLTRRCEYNDLHTERRPKENGTNREEKEKLISYAKKI